jgi:hypothetical protein
MLMQQPRGQLTRIAEIAVMARKFVACKERRKGVMANLLGLIFIFIVMFSPGGLSGAYYRLRLKALSRKSS